MLCLTLTVLPSFSGNVPAALRKIYPSAKITRLGDWYVAHFICTNNSCHYHHVHQIFLLVFYYLHSLLHFHESSIWSWLFFPSKYIKHWLFVSCLITDIVNMRSKVWCCHLHFLNLKTFLFLLVPEIPFHLATYTAPIFWLLGLSIPLFSC